MELSNETDFARILELEEAYIKGLCDDIIALKPTLVFTEKGISDLAQHFLAKGKIFDPKFDLLNNYELVNKLFSSWNHGYSSCAQNWQFTNRSCLWRDDQKPYRRTDWGRYWHRMWPLRNQKIRRRIFHLPHWVQTDQGLYYYSSRCIKRCFDGGRAKFARRDASRSQRYVGV